MPVPVCVPADDRARHPAQWLRGALLVAVVVALVLVGTIGESTRAAAPGLAGPAGVGAVARRGASWSPSAACDMVTVTALAARHPTVGQFVVVASPSWASVTATIDVAVRDDTGVWRCQSAGLDARLGRAGSRPLAERRSGDDTTPAGVFPLGTATAWDGQRFDVFGNRPDPGVRGRYREVRPQDCWGATPNTPGYQHLVDRPGCTAPDEWLTAYGDVYSHAAVIGANLDPISGDEPGEPALAAAIFLHRHSYDGAGRARPTSGCVSMAGDDLVSVLRDLDPARAPQFAIGPRDWLRQSA